MLHKIAIFVLKGTRPLLGPTARCHFTISCTEFAIIELKNNSLIRALWNITVRLLLCNPLFKSNL